MKIKPALLALITIVIILGGIGIAQLSGIWSTTSNGGSEGGGGGYGGGRNETVTAGSLEPEDIRGSFTFASVATAFEIDPAVLLTAFGLPADLDPADLRTGDLEALYESSGLDIGNGSVKIFVSMYKNIPMDLEEDSYLPVTAIDIIQAASPDLTAEQQAFLISNTTAHQPDLSALSEH